MGDIKRHVDTWSWIVMFITSVLFVAAAIHKRKAVCTRRNGALY
jgi:hypothetical protein